MIPSTFNRNFTTITMLGLLFIMFWLSMPEHCEGRPSWAMPSPGLFQYADTECEPDSELQELCQRCAKATKSPIAYPMCCKNVDNAANWCKDYVYFGIQGSSDS